MSQPTGEREVFWVSVPSGMGERLQSTLRQFPFINSGELPLTEGEIVDLYSRRQNEEVAIPLVSNEDEIKPEFPPDLEGGRDPEWQKELEALYALVNDVKSAVIHRDPDAIGAFRDLFEKNIDIIERRDARLTTPKNRSFESFVSDTVGFFELSLKEISGHRERPGEMVGSGSDAKFQYFRTPDFLTPRQLRIFINRRGLRGKRTHTDDELAKQEGLKTVNSVSDSARNRLVDHLAPYRPNGAFWQ